MHSEWSSCLSFLHQNKELLKDFKSVHFTHDLSAEEAPDFAALDEYKFENDRHRVIVALLIADFFLFLMKHLKYNHVIQFIYVSQLVVDANGVLVLLKFLNQDFAKLVDFSANKADQAYDFIYDADSPLELEKIMERSVNSLLKLMYKTCRNQSQRIKDYLVQYKAAVSVTWLSVS